jgi:hypothetical protein
MDKKIAEAQQEFNAILDFVIRSARCHEIHQVEDSLHRMLLRLGRILLELFVLAVGNGMIGKELVTQDGAVYRYLKDSKRKYLSIFGEITIPRAYYAKEGREGLVPLDARLNLPRRKYSYPLQDRMAYGASKQSYEATVASLKKDLCLDLAHRPIQEVTRDCTAAVEEFMDSLSPPLAQLEGPILVHTVDCKGVRMRPGERNTKQAKTKDKPGEKLMACVAAVYSIFPHFRPKEAIADTFYRPADSKTAKAKDPHRPKPLFRRTFVSLKDPKSEVFRKSGRLAKARIHEGTEEKLALMDGEVGLKSRSREVLPDWPEALDITHAVERLRLAGQLHYGSKPAAHEYGRERLLLLLGGKVGDVIEDWEAAIEDGTLCDSKAKELKSTALGYFRNNEYRMGYDQLLAKGLPIASGVIESTCNSLINTRMEGPGMFWSKDGAEAILKLRAVFLDDLWEEFWAFRIKREKQRLYARYQNISAVGQEAAPDRKAA